MTAQKGQNEMSTAYQKGYKRGIVKKEYADGPEEVFNPKTYDPTYRSEKDRGYRVGLEDAKKEENCR